MSLNYRTHRSLASSTHGRWTSRLGIALSACTALFFQIGSQTAEGQSTSFTASQAIDYPFASELVAAASGSRIAWVLNESGVRNVWVAEGPSFTARRLTSYTADDGQEMSDLQISHDGMTVIYVRGGDHDGNWPAENPPDPSAAATMPHVELYAVPFTGGTPKMLAEGDDPAISPRGDRVAFIKAHQAWQVPVDGGKAASQLFYSRGETRTLVWSPAGDRLAFVSDRGDHSFIGIFESDSLPIRYVSPSTSRDDSPQWSPDGRQLVFVRRPGVGGAPKPLLEQHPEPWAIWVATAATGIGRPVWTSPSTLNGSFPDLTENADVLWAATDRVVFRAELDGWPHIYSVSSAGGEPMLLTAGNYTVEHVAASPDRKFLVYSANTGGDTNDIDRRHIYRVPVDRAAPVAITAGAGVEWTPVVTGDGRTVSFIAATVTSPPLTSVASLDAGSTPPVPRAINLAVIPRDFPGAQMVAPRKVVFRAADGVMVHGQLFERPGGGGGGGAKPAVIFVHGGPPRQMLLGWHYMEYYSHAYAMEQFLASHGYVVLSVNYRLGIGYGRAFQHPEHSGPWGASEYNDVLAGRAFLGTLPEVDGTRVGIWGGSYGGFLTALALARNSNLFAAGVDLHGVHDWLSDFGDYITKAEARFEKADIAAALQVAWQSSPVASVASWRSPVLLIHGDDDHNVHFSQTVDLVQRLSASGIAYEELVLPNEIHGFLRHQSWLVSDSTMVAFLDRKLKDRR
jgi:dipeptidyl aminopeptidase/acylaminoacyl peptidase